MCAPSVALHTSKLQSSSPHVLPSVLGVTDPTTETTLPQRHLNVENFLRIHNVCYIPTQITPINVMSGLPGGPALPIHLFGSRKPFRLSDVVRWKAVLLKEK